MALNAEQMAKNTTKAVQAAMKIVNPLAKAEPFQEILMLAIANGLIKTLTTKGRVIATAPADIDLGLSGRGLVTNPDIMYKAAFRTMLILLGGKAGPALPPLLKAILYTIQIHLLKDTEIVSISGFGGAAVGIVNVTPITLMKNIINELPEENRKQVTESLQGGNLVKSISVGLMAGLAGAITGVVPFGTTGTTGFLIGQLK